MEFDYDHERRLTETEQRSKSNTHRLERLEPIVSEMHKMSEAMVEMANELKHTNSSIKNLDEKVDRLEQEPAKKWNDSTKAIFNAFLGAIGSAIGVGLLWLLANTV